MMLLTLYVTQTHVVSKTMLGHAASLVVTAAATAIATVAAYPGEVVIPQNVIPLLIMQLFVRMTVKTD